MRLLFPILLILFSLAGGITLRSIFHRTDASGRGEDTLRRWLQKLCFLYLNPVVLIGAVWILPLDNLEILLLPLLGVVAIAIGGVYSIIYSRWRGMPRSLRGSHFCVSYYTNIGSVGGLVVYTMLGEAGFVLLPLYKLLEPLMYFGIGFPIAALFGNKGAEKKRSLWNILADPVVVISMSSIALGFVLNFSELVRLEFYTPLNGFLIPTMSSLLLVSIGLGMDFKNMKGHILSAASVAGIKFILVPLTMTFLAWLLGMGKLMGGLPLMTVYILSSMPAGFVSIIPASLYGLDLDYANTAWIMTMILMVIVVPWIAFCLTFLLPLLL